jgi:hypothetical protein
MSETKVFAVAKGNTTRVRSNGDTQGAGDGKRHYVGRYSGDQHEGFLQFTHDWTNVKTIVSAVLTLYADDGLGILGDTMPSGSPRIHVRRLTSAFSEGTNPGATWQDNDYTNPSATTSGEVYKSPSRVALEPTQIDITTIVRAMAPATVTGGGKATNHGITILGNTSTDDNYAYISDDAESGVAALKPTITLTYEYGLTVPTTPTVIEPSGAVSALTGFRGTFADIKTTDKLARSQVQVYTSAATNAGQVVTGGTLLYDVDQPESETASQTAIFDHVPSVVSWLATSTTYKWRARVKDQEGQWSLYTNLTSFSVTNTAPTAPVLSPASGSDFDSLDGINFAAPFVDVDAGDTLLAYQIELSDVATPGHANWDDPNHIYWETGKRYVVAGSTEFRVPYGGAGLAAGTYYWRARYWDNNQSASNWTYATIVVNAAFAIDPTVSTNAIQSRPRAPWRILIKEMKFNAVGGNVTGNAGTDTLTTATPHGLTADAPLRFSALTGGTGLVVGKTYYVYTVPTSTTFTIQDHVTGQVLFSTNVTAGTMTRVTTRGPGNTVAVLEDAMNVGASILYNSPGEIHFTLGADHPQLPVIEPKQTHYAVEFRQGDGWREVFQGLVWDYDASDNDIVFYGLDYLALLDYVIDEHYDPANVDKVYTSGGSKYVATAISTIITNQLTRSREDPNSPVGFISTGAIASFTETVTAYSTYQPCLNFIVGLIDSHRAGQNRRSRLYVKKTANNTYQWVLADNPGVVRDNLRLRFGELVQGYRVIPFGNDWATRISAIGRDKDGVRVRYGTKSGTGINEAIWGKFSLPMFIDGVSDANDFTRRVQQAAQAAGKLGKQVALGIRSGFLLPRDGYDLLDQFPIDIQDGSVLTTNFGSGYWTAVGITWTALQRGDLNTTLTFAPREDDTPPSNDLLTAHNISTTAEWQIGWTPPTVVTPVSRYWLDQSTGIVYERVGGTLVVSGISGAI